MRSLLLTQLEIQRAHVHDALDGLAEAALRVPVPPTTWAPLAAMHHLALDVERWWFGAVIANDPAAWAYFDAHPRSVAGIPRPPAVGR